MEKAGKLLESLLGRSLSLEAQKYSSFFGFFSDILGESLRKHIKIKDIDKNVVIAETAHPGWIQIFGMQKAQILDKIRSRYPDLEIRDIHVRLALKNGPGNAGEYRRE